MGNLVVLAVLPCGNTNINDINYLCYFIQVNWGPGDRAIMIITRPVAQLCAHNIDTVVRGDGGSDHTIILLSISDHYNCRDTQLY